MNHHEHHREHHDKEREKRIEHEKARERQDERQPRTIHPLWFLVLGTTLIVAVVLMWIFIIP